ncbi:unnamed protein product [Allacma fusca]|uniref:Uncharacterized protein n=1 Tax=Allacma fusca TaxID=39272 RepID=A0A8J2JJJ8_9HEXA|nr:unnamed protein product [Allacma fusca]
MHIVSRRNMLALPVERLVGNSNHSHRRPPMSPDSSASDSSNSDSPSTTNAKVFSSYASQLLSNNGSINSSQSSSGGNNGRRSESPVMNNNNHFISSSMSEETEGRVKSSPRRSVSPPSVGSLAESQSQDGKSHEEEKPDKGLLLTGSQSMTLLSNKDRNREDRVEIQFPGKVERDNSPAEAEGSRNGPSGNSRPSVVIGEAESQKMTIRIIEDDVEGSSLNNSLSKMDNTLDDSSDENNSICGRPPSRPPSSSSSTVTSATFPLSPNSVSEAIIKGSNAMLTRPQHHPHHHHHHHHNNSSLHGNSLKFSIEDILRPEFGKVALQRIRRTSSSTHNRRHSVNSNSFLEYPDSPFSSGSSSNPHRTVDANHLGRSLSHSPRCDSIDSSNNSTVRHVRTGPSSIRDHSEDSNSSCTSRKEEVVDETKVNPPVPQGPLLWPAWVYCTRYSDRPSSGKKKKFL